MIVWAGNLLYPAAIRRTPISELPYSVNASPAPNNIRNAANWIGSIGSQVSTIVLSDKQVVRAYTIRIEPLNPKSLASSKE